MNWPAIISEIQAAGWSQPKIAAECQCAQSTISDLAGGRTKDPRYTIGEKLKRIAELARNGSLRPVAVAPTDAQGIADSTQNNPQSLAEQAQAAINSDLQGVAHA